MDDKPFYGGMANFNHASVKHSIGEYVRNLAQTSGAKSF